MTYFLRKLIGRGMTWRLEPRLRAAHFLVVGLPLALVGACGRDGMERQPEAEGSGGYRIGVASKGGTTGTEGGAGGEGGESAILCSSSFAPSPDDATACDECVPGEYCPGGVAAQNCGDGTWDDDGDPVTACVDWTDRYSECGWDALVPGTATTDTSCMQSGWDLVWKVDLDDFYPSVVGFHSEGDIVALGRTAYSDDAQTRVVLASAEAGSFIWDTVIFDGNLVCGFIEAADKDLVIACRPNLGRGAAGLRVTRLSWPEGDVEWSVALGEDSANSGSSPPRMQLDGADAVLIQVGSELEAKLSLLNGEELEADEEVTIPPLLSDEQQALVDQVHETEIDPIMDFITFSFVERLHAQIAPSGDVLGVTKGIREGGEFTDDPYSFVWKFTPDDGTLLMTQATKGAYAVAFGEGDLFACATNVYLHDPDDPFDEDYLILYAPIGD